MYPRQRVDLPVVFLAFAAVSVEGHLPLPRLVEEAAQLREICEAAQHAGKCELILRENVTLTQILDTFQRPDLRGRIAVFHFSGHADGYELLLEEAAGRKLLVDAAGLAAFLAEQEGLKFVFLNACSTQAQVLGLHAAGVKSVLATTEDVLDDEALRFAVRFYKGFIGGASLASAFRASVASERALQGGHNEFPWQLYLHDDQVGEWTLDAGEASVLNWRVPFLRDKAFVGRELDLENIHAELTPSSNVGVRPLVLTGMGGIGKTQLAVEYCYRYVKSYPDGVFWINAAVDWQDEFAELGTYIEPGLAGEPKARRIRSCADYIKAHPNCLLVLDNVHDPGQIWRPVTPDLIPAGLPCRLLLTTRLHNLANVRAVEVTVLPERVALQLLLRHECRHAVLAPSHFEHAEAKQICAVVGYLPLALVIAGAHVGSRPQLALAVYRQHLLNRGALTILDNPLGGVRSDDLATRHEAAIAATLAEQWDAVATDTARLLLRVVGQLPEGAVIPITRLGLLTDVRETDDNLFGSPLELALTELHRLSLVEELHHAAIRCHPLVSQFAAGLTPQAETACFRRDCAKRLSEAYKDVLELERQCALRGVEAVEQDLRSALDLLPIEQDPPSPTQYLRELLRMVQLESHTLREWNSKDEPMRFLQQWRKRTLTSLHPQQAEESATALSNLGVPYLSLLWTTAREPANLVRTLDGHTSWVVCVAVTPDGRRVVSGSYDHALKVWDLESGRELHTLVGHSDWVVSVTVTPDGRRVVSTSRDNTIKVWDLASGRELHTLDRKSDKVFSVAVTTDSVRVVSALDDHTLKVWDLESGSELHTLRGHTNAVYFLTTTPSGRCMISASRDQTIKLWDLESGFELRTLEGHSDSVFSVAVTSDGRRAIVASGDGALRVWDLESGSKLQNLSGGSYMPVHVVMTPDGRRAVSVGFGGPLTVWDLERGGELHTLKAQIWDLRMIILAVTPDGRWAVTGSHAHNTLKVWDLESGSELYALSGHSEPVKAVTVTPDGRRAISASDDGTLRVWDLASGSELPPPGGHSWLVRTVTVTPDGRRAVSASGDHTLKVWDLETGRELHTLEGHTNVVYSLPVTPDGRRAVSASDDHTLKVWDLETGRELHTLTGHSDWVVAAAVTPDGRKVVSGSYDHTVRVWNMESGRELHTLKGHKGDILALAIAPDGRAVVSASEDGTLKVWELETGREMGTLEGHRGWAVAMAVTQDGRQVVSASDDGLIRVQDLESGRDLQTLSSHADRLVEAVAITPDGGRAVFASFEESPETTMLAGQRSLSPSLNLILEVLDLKRLGALQAPVAAMHQADNEPDAQGESSFPSQPLRRTWRRVSTQKSHPHWLRALALTADGWRAASVSTSNALEIWNLEPLLMLTKVTLDDKIMCVSIAPDGVTIVVGDITGNIHCLRYCVPRQQGG